MIIIFSSQARPEEVFVERDLSRYFVVVNENDGLVALGRLRWRRGDEL